MAQSRLQFTGLRTKDGKEFSDKKEAYLHQNKIDLCDVWDNCSINGSESFYELLLENRTLLAELVRLTAIPREKSEGEIEETEE